MFSNLFPPVMSGSSIHLYALAAELAKHGCEVTIITAKIDNKSPDFEIINNVEIYRLPSFHFPKLEIALNFPWLNFTYTLFNQTRIDRIVKKKQPDVLHLHNHMFDLSFSAVRTAKKFRIPLVVTIHTIIKHPIKLYDVFLSFIDQRILKRKIIDQAQAIICPDKVIEEYVKVMRLAR
jgi:glycosyltransferase involved in cell wall biosynthesis